MPDEFDLSKSFSLQELASWRLHWLACDASSLLRDIIAEQPRGQDAKQAILRHKERAMRLNHGVDRLAWEISTMCMHDYPSDVLGAMSGMPKYIALQQALLKVRDALESRLQAFLDAERREIGGSLDGFMLD